MSNRDWQSRYDATRKKLWYGSFQEAFKEADSNYHKAQSSSAAWSWRFQILKAQALQFQGKPREALALLDVELPPGLPSEARARKTIVHADTLCRLGDPQSAEPILTKSEQLISIADRDLQAELALTRGRCALFASSEAAKGYYSLASSLAHGGDEFIEATAFLNLGFQLVSEGHYNDGNRKLLEGAKVTSSPLLQEKILGDLGFSYSQTGEMRRAIPFSQQAEELASKINNSTDEKKWLIDLGREYFHQLEYTKADDSFGKALKLAEDLGDKGDTAICLHDLAQLALRTHDLNKANDYIRRLQDLKPRGGNYLDLLLDQGEMAKARREFPAAEGLLKQLLEQMSQQQGIETAVRWTAQSDLADTYAAREKFGLAEKMFRQAITTAETGRSNAESVESRISFLEQDAFYDQYVKFLVSRNRPVEALAIAEQGRSPTLSESFASNGRTRGIDIRQIQAVLKRERQIVLAYWLGWEESYLWVITPTQVKLIGLPAELDIEKEIEAYNKEIVAGGTLESLQTRGQGLYQILVGPAEPFLYKGWGVIIVPHRKLYNLNFETLVAPAPTPHFWIEDVASHNVSFLNALTSSPARRSGVSKDLLLVGAPLLADKQFPVLKHAPAEMEKVAAHFPAAQEFVIQGKDATPAAYLASNPGQFRHVHFVTHGTSSTVLENPLDSAIILSPAQGAAASTADPEASYHLYGKDIMKTPLHADLVIVSACYGMGREYSGEGLVGLAWAFLRAGAHQVIAALWEVDDASTPQLMDDFYAEYTHGKSAAEALRDAKLRMLHSNGFHKRPYYWASLQLYTGS